MPSPSPEGFQAYRHPLAVRLAHWVNALCLLVLLLSGLRIYWAYPSFVRFPQWFYGRFSMGGWLAGALRWHFAAMWIFAVNGLLYLLYLVWTRNVGRVVPNRPEISRGLRSPREALRPETPLAAEAYSPWQKVAYALMIFLFGALGLLSGLVLYKPVQAGWLTEAFGGYQASRLWHFFLVPVLALFLAVHTALAVREGWGRFRGMLSGWRDEEEALLRREG